MPWHNVTVGLESSNFIDEANGEDLVLSQLAEVIGIIAYNVLLLSRHVQTQHVSTGPMWLAA